MNSLVLVGNPLKDGASIKTLRFKSPKLVGVSKDIWL